MDQIRAMRHRQQYSNNNFKNKLSKVMQKYFGLMKQNENNSISDTEEMMARKQHWSQSINTKVEAITEKIYSDTKQLNHVLRVKLKKYMNHVVSIEETHDAIAGGNIKLKQKVADLSEQLDLLKMRLKNYETSIKQFCRQVASNEKIDQMKSTMEKYKIQKEQSSTETSWEWKKQMESQSKKILKL